MHIPARDSILRRYHTTPQEYAINASTLTPGLLIAAPNSGSGKSLLTLCLLAGFAKHGMRLASAKIGPDYIDAAFQRAASRGICINLDAWSMRPRVLLELAAFASTRGAQLLIAEGVMGLFDGARDGFGTTADIARMTGWPIILVVDGRGIGHSVGAIIKGFNEFRKEITISGILLNRVTSPLHYRLLESGCREIGMEIMGAFPESPSLRLPHRHLGLVQADEHSDLEAFLQTGAKMAERYIDLERLLALAHPLVTPTVPRSHAPFPPPAQHIAIANDVAFSFVYPIWFDAWRKAGAEISFFSPLADEAPSEYAEFIFLPGGYPELHSGRLAAATRFLQGLRDGANRGATIYGECGGYLALGRGLIDKKGERFELAGLLPLEGRFQNVRHLGYRRIRLLANGFLGKHEENFRGHEFHYADELPQIRRTSVNSVEPLFSVQPPCHEGEHIQPSLVGMKIGRVMGSFLHLVDRSPTPGETGKIAPLKKKDSDNGSSSSVLVPRFE